ncbi:MAG: hypothetical protein ACREC5_05560, partial [Thermoplasmata archaeon]
STDPDREVRTRTEDGAQIVRAGSRPSNVLFLVPAEGTRTYQNWEWCLGYLRLEQGRRRLVRQQVAEAEAERTSAEEEVQAIRERHARLDSRLRELEDRARRAKGGGTPAELVPGLAGARENLAAYRAVLRRKETVELRLKGLRDHLVPRVYPGLWGRINAFLDLQALSVASVAGEEFRKFPRPLSSLAARLERQLKED